MYQSLTVVQYMKMKFILADVYALSATTIKKGCITCPPDSGGVLGCTGKLKVDRPFKRGEIE